MSAYKTDFDEAKYMSFLIKDNDLVKTYPQIWDKVNEVITIGFDSKPVYNKKYLKTKMESYEEKVNTNFHNDKMRKRGSSSHLIVSGID